MKRYTFKYKDKEIFITTAGNNENALSYAKKEGAFEFLDDIKIGPYCSAPSITVLVEDLCYKPKEEDLENESTE